jgi:hypothetical protein
MKGEFKNLPSGWKVVRLGDVFDIQSGSTPSRQNFYYWENTSIYWVKTTDLNNNFISDTEEKISEIGLKESSCKVYPKNTILIAMYGGFNQIGRTGILQIEAATNQAISALLPSTKANSLFVNNILICYRNKWKNIAISSRKDPNITKRDIENFKIPLPPLDEQEKIAEILSTWDEAINLTINLIENKKQFKKALMQNLLTAKVRFPEFQDEWEKVKLKEISEVYQPQTISQRELTDSGFDVYGANGIIGKYGRYNHEFEQVVVGCRGNCGAVNFTKPKSWITGNAMVVNLDNSTKSIKTFIYYSLLNTNFQYLISGSGQPQITSDIKYHEIKLPNLNEQQKIAEVLTACDDEINLLNLKLENLKNQKQGLMQKLLSGKARI